HCAGGVVVKIGGNGGKLLSQRGELLLRILQASASSIEGRLRRDMRGQEILLTVEFGVEITDVILCLLDLRLHVPVICLECIQGISDRTDLCLSARQREPQLKIIQSIQNLPGLDMLILCDTDFRDDS